MTFTAAALSVCTVSGSTVTFTGVGTCTIDANQSGNSDYLPAPQVTQGIMVAKAGTTLVAAPESSLSQFSSLGLTLSATLTSNTTGMGLAQQPVTFSLDGMTACTATTNTHGVATCTASFVYLLLALFSSSYSATYAGNANDSRSTATGKLTGL